MGLLPTLPSPWQSAGLCEVGTLTWVARMPCLIPVLCVPVPMTPPAVTSDTAPRLGSAGQSEEDTRDQPVRLPWDSGLQAVVRGPRSRIVDSSPPWVLVSHFPRLHLSDSLALLVSEPQFPHLSGLSHELVGAWPSSEGAPACIALGFPQPRSSLLSVPHPSTTSSPPTQGPSVPKTSLDAAW